MSTLLQHALNHKILTLNSIKFVVPCRLSSTTKKVGKLPRRVIFNAPIRGGRADSLLNRGFQRNLRPYNPPENASEVILNCIMKVLGTTSPKRVLNTEEKFALLSALNDELDYVAPNSILYKLRTIKDVTEFFSTPIDTTNPYDEFKKIELPPNLHILYDYHRFNPNTDTKFNGISAFPRTSTITSSLKLKKKYPGFVALPPWSDI